MKRLKAVLSVALCAVLLLGLLAGCTGGGDDMGNIVYGRYVEEDISPENMTGSPMSLTAFSNGALDLVAVNWGGGENELPEYLRWRSTDGGDTWEQLDMSWSKEYINDYSDYYDKGEQPPEEINLGSVIPYETGEVIFQVYTYTYDKENEYYNYSSELYRLSADGSSKEVFTIPEVETAKQDGANVSVQDIRALPGGRLYLSYYIEPTQEQMQDENFDWNSTDRRGVYDVQTGEKLYDVNVNGWEMLNNETTLFINDYEKGGYQAINLADGSPSNAPMPSQEMLQRVTGSGYQSSFVDNENNFYRVSPRGLEKAGPETEELEQIMDGLNYTYGSPLYGINATVYDAAKKSLILGVYESRNYENGISGKLLRYVWDDKAIASSDKKIKVYSLHDNYSVRLALSEYKRQFPEVTIEYETAFEPEDGSMMGGMGYTVASMARAPGEEEGEDPAAMAKTEEDALRALNTELLNGTGPDVLILDGLPVESFVEKGVLEDLSALVKENDDIVASVFEPLYKDDKLYALPTNFFVPTLMGEKGYVEQYTSLDKLVAGIVNGADVPGYQEMSEDWTPEEQDAYFRELYGPKAAEDQPVLYFESLEDLFTTFYASCAPSIFSEKGGINQENLATFLQYIKEVADKYNLADENFMGMGGGSMSMSWGYASYEFSQTLSRFSERQSRLGYSRLGSFEILSNLSYNLHWSRENNYGKGIAVAEPVGGDVMEGEEGLAEGLEEDSVPDASSIPDANSMPDASSMPEDGDAPVDDSSLDETRESEKLPEIQAGIVSMPGLAQGAYFPTQMVGVSTASKRSQLAMDFVSVMLSENVQKYDMGNGFPVLKSAFSTQNDTYTKSDDYAKREGVKMVEFEYEGLLEQLSVPFYANDYLRAVIYKPVEGYCMGQMSLDDTVGQIVKETELYFAERQ